MEADKLITVLFKIKDARAQAQREFDEADAALAAKQEKVESALLSLLKEQGLDNASFVTSDGQKLTVTRTVKTRMWPADWDAFRHFEQEHPEYDFRERRVHQKNLADFMKSFPDVQPPINVDSKYAVSTRRTKQ